VAGGNEHAKRDLRVEHEIRGHAPGDRTGRAEARDHRRWIARHVREAGDDPAEQIEEQIFDRAERLLDVVPEDEEEQHVPADVQPATVHEHRREEREPERVRTRRLVDLDRRPIGQREDLWTDDVAARRDLRRHRAVPVGEGRIRELIEEDEDVEGDDREIDDRDPRPVVLVTERDHGRRLRRLPTERQKGLRYASCLEIAMRLIRYCGRERLPGGERVWRRLALRAGFAGTRCVFGYGAGGRPGVELGSWSFPECLESSSAWSAARMRSSSRSPARSEETRPTDAVTAEPVAVETLEMILRTRWRIRSASGRPHSLRKITNSSPP